MRGEAALQRLNTTGAGKISHVVFIVQENRSFDNMFQGYPGADTVSKGKNSKGETVQLQPQSLGYELSIDHSAQAMFEACNGTGKLPGTDCRMDGFDLEKAWPPFQQNPQYVYVPQSESAPYFAMAHEGVLADKTFASQLDESFVAHQYIIAAQADWAVDLPVTTWGCGASKVDTIPTITKDRNPNGPAMKPCFDYETLGDEFDKAKLSWRFYASPFGKDATSRARVVGVSRRAPYPIRPRLDQRRDLAELEVHHRRSCRAARKLHMDHAALPRLRSHQLRRRIRPVVGFGARQYGRPE